jgi:hypothetical protein
VGLDAERANREAAFNLEQQSAFAQMAAAADASQMDRLGWGANLAGMASAESIDRFDAGMGAAEMGQQAQIGRLGAMTQAAGQADVGNANLWSLGMQGATTAQQMEESRLQAKLNNMMAPIAGQSAALDDAQDRMSDADLAIFASMSEAEVASYMQGLSVAERQRLQMNGDWNKIMGIAGTAAGGGAGAAASASGGAGTGDTQAYG